jgi:hypothetical protein
MSRCRWILVGQKRTDLLGLGQGGDLGREKVARDHRERAEGDVRGQAELDAVA